MEEELNYLSEKIEELEFDLENETYEKRRLSIERELEILQTLLNITTSYALENQH